MMVGNVIERNPELIKCVCNDVIGLSINVPLGNTLVSESIVFSKVLVSGF